ncbi:hypothetical protein [Phaeovulum vinaykumarii]|uniref:Uncharacterized protein n=1 Tax=Phaeovulum vinaykumarii TaxID=407234 RepID=A0A1N7KXW9_9RHOB|nr:hypothetical protein [Phaeovulum vinaykumarii]SIS66482.1 hypothetical protein SAMN05421795_102299 [Phaeovulum vinaykumarii]SOC01072.1 hypothetical protein SAMN05878426_102473 [Phaeovulum vinaykumarii]
MKDSFLRIAAAEWVPQAAHPVLFGLGGLSLGVSIVATVSRVLAG